MTDKTLDLIANAGLAAITVAFSAVIVAGAAWIILRLIRGDR